MAWASPAKVALGSISFLVFWVMAVFPNVKIMPIGRTAGSVCGAVLMVVFQLLSPNEAFNSVDLSILGLLFGTMVVGVYLERADLFKYLALALNWKSYGGKDLLWRVCVLSAVSSALFTNDTTCVVLTPFILKLCNEKNLHPEPFLMALATSSNIGSVATPIGNPQNLVIAVKSKISFGKFLVGLLPAMVVGVAINIVLLIWRYWKHLGVLNIENGGKNVDGKDVIADHAIPEQVVAPEDGNNDNEVDDEEVESKHSIIEINELLGLEPKGSFSQRGSRSPGMPSSPCRPPLNDDHVENMEALPKEFNRFQKVGVYVVVIGMLAALLYGLNLSWSAITAAVVLMVLGFADARPSLDQVSYSLLVFFSGMFISVEGFNKTGAPEAFWDVVRKHASINSIQGIALLSVVVIFLSNTVSNVPTVLLLGTRVAASAAAIPGTSVTKAWLILAWVSTVAGNLTMLGSAANLIVSEQAKRAKAHPFNLSFWKHFKFGFPSTWILVAVGLPLIKR